MIHRLKSELEKEVDAWYDFIEGNPLRKAVSDKVVSEYELKYFGSYLILLNLVIESTFQKMENPPALDPYTIDNRARNIFSKLKNVSVDDIDMEIVRLGCVLEPYGAAEMNRYDISNEN